jgi:hypothetical protein
VADAVEVGLDDQINRVLSEHSIERLAFTPVGLARRRAVMSVKVRTAPPDASGIEQTPGRAVGPLSLIPHLGADEVSGIKPCPLLWVAAVELTTSRWKRLTAS